MLALAVKLPPITDKQRQWAFDHCFAPRAVYKIRKHEVRCLCCGQTAVWDKPFIESFVDVEQYDCPYCGKTMSIEQHTKATQYREFERFTILTTFRGHQIARTFEVDRCNYSSEHFARYDCNEVFQTWLLPDGKEVITGRPLHRSAFYTTWDFHKPLDIKHHNASCTGAYQFDDIYDITGSVFYPDARVTPLLRRNGWTRKLMGYQKSISMIEAMRYLLTVPTAEMLVKTGQLDLFLNMVRRGNKELPYLHSVRIANRNGYVISDAQMWLDMLQLASDLHLDTHNPSVVCPDDLKDAHDRLLRRYNRHRARIEIEKLAKETPAYESQFQKAKAAFFGISLTSDNVQIRPLSSVMEIAEEGMAMHHCVYSNNYFKKTDSLILGARDHNGRRLETVELSLKTFRVLQSRGKFNQSTPLHAEIVKLVESNADLFRNIVASHPA